MKTTPLVLFLIITASLSALAHAERKSIHYSIGDTEFESTIIHSPSAKKVRPGILMVPNWMGPTEAALEKAEKIAGDDYVIMVVDMYGTDTRPTNGSEAGKAAGFVRSNRALMRERAELALSNFIDEAKNIGLDQKQIAAIGFCFGGGTVLELGRTGTDLDAIISFHGDLLSPTLEADAKNNQAKILVLHGADDPYVPQADVQQFITAMQATETDWQLMQYSKTVHSFTDPSAKSAGAHYNEKSSRRAFEAMEELLDEIWDD